MARHILERQIEEYLRTQSRIHGFLALKFTSPSGAGVPDRLVLAGARQPFVELKRPGGRPTKLQRARHAQMRAHGAEVHVIDTFEGVDQLIRELVDSRAQSQPHLAAG